MSPPVPHPPPQATSGNSRGSSGAQNPAFQPQYSVGMPPSGSQTSGVPMSMFQLQQLQAAHQQAILQQSMLQNPQMNTGMSSAIPNQFFVSTNTTAQGAVPSGSMPQMQAVIQQALAANSGIPLFIMDPNAYMQAIQKNAQMQCSMAPIQSVGAQVPNLQMQSLGHQFPVLPPQVYANMQSQQAGQLASQKVQFPAFPRPVPVPSVDSQQPQPQPQPQPQLPNPNVQVQACANDIQKALQDPKTEAAGQVLLSSEQSSAYHVNDLMKKEQQQGHPLMKEQQQQATPNTVESDETLKTNIVLNHVFLESSLEPVEREEDSNDQAAEEEMWKYFFKCDEDNSNHNSEEFITPSLFSSSRNSPSSPVETSPSQRAVQSDAVASMAPFSNQAAPVPPTTAVLQPSPFKQESSPKIVPVRAECGKVKKHSLQRQRPFITFEFKGSPQEYLMAILRERGYSSDRIPNSQTGFKCKPTPLELASFGTEVVKAVHSGDVAKLRTLLECGLSPSPCNSFGEFIVNLVCRRAEIGILQCLVDYGCNLEVHDSFGRTPLHCVAWAGEFCRESAELILNTNTNMILVEDNRGQCPLEYVRKELWPEWINFLRTKMDTYWPIDGQPMLPSTQTAKRKQVPEISLELASAVASGAVTPDAVAAMDATTRRYYKEESLSSILFT